MGSAKLHKGYNVCATVLYPILRVQPVGTHIEIQLSCFVLQNMEVYFKFGSDLEHT